MTRLLRQLAPACLAWVAAASTGCGATTPTGPTAVVGIAPSANDVRQVASRVDDVLADAFQMVAAALADGDSSVTFDVSSPCSSQGTARIAGGWSGTLPGRERSGTLQLDVRITFAEEVGGSCVEGAARLAGELSLSGFITFAGGKPASSTTLQEGGEVTFVLNNVAGVLQRRCTHTIEVETRNVICDGDVSLQYPRGTAVTPAPAC